MEHMNILEKIARCLSDETIVRNRRNELVAFQKNIFIQSTHYQTIPSIRCLGMEKIWIN